MSRRDNRGVGGTNNIQFSPKFTHDEIRIVGRGKSFSG